MSGRIKYIACILAILLAVIPLTARGVVVSGYVRDKASGEPLMGATLLTSDKSTGICSDSTGFFGMYLDPGEYDIVCSMVGFTTMTLHADARNADASLLFEMDEDVRLLDEVSILSSTVKDILELPQMGLQKLNASLARKIPALLGETDIIRVVQMMPGVQSPSEGSTGLSVRGGGTDQNLILMDDAPVYNTAHFLGFLSIFNGDVIDKVQLYKADFPARFGSKTSSVLDINTVDGSGHDLKGSASIGIVSSKFHLSGPLVTDRLTFSVAARHSYLNKFFPLFSGIPDGTQLVFYDVNAKLSWNPDANNRVQLSVFSGDDRMGLAMDDFSFRSMLFDNRNNTQSLRWNHIFSSALTSAFTVYNSLYKGTIDLDMDGSPLAWNNNLNETGIRHAFTWHLGKDNTIDMGWEAAYIHLNPSECHPVGDESVIVDVVAPVSNAISPALYVEDQIKSGIFSLRYGLRYSAFTRVGNDDENKWYHGLDPRASVSVNLNKETALKASYARTHQYVEQASISATGGVLDTWFAASKRVKPHVSDQLSLGLSRFLYDDAVEFSAEGFYKNNRNTVDLKDNAGLVILEPDPESLLRFGTSYACGLELMARYEFSKLSGWFGYTWTKSMFDIEGINNNVPYRSPLCHEHAVNIVTNWEISPRVSASASWIFYSGAPTTFPTGKFSYGSTYMPIYSSRNEDNMPDYHRADLSVTVKGKKRVEQKPWSGEWNFSIYNLYSRHNAWSISYGYNEKTDAMEGKLVYLFPIVPSVSYNLEF